MSNTENIILILEDDSRQREALEAGFAQENCHVITVSNGRDGLEILKQKKPDIILLDLMMPVLDGFSFLDAIKDNEEFSNIPVIILTNLGTQERLTNLINLKCDCFFTKTNTPLKEIIAKTKELLTNPICKN